jgi:hypothetical protein
MGYRIRYHREAKLDLDKCMTTYAPTPLPGRLRQWLKELAEEAESKEWALSIDLESLAEHIDDAEQLVRQWPNVWQRFWDARFVDKLRAATVVFTEWRQPYKPRAAIRVFTLYSEDFDVVAQYLLDHAAKEVVFMAFDGLPMQSYE